MPFVPMSDDDEPTPAHRPTPATRPLTPSDRPGAWFAPALISTGVTVLLLPIVAFWYGMSAMAFDGCGPDACPEASTHVDLAGLLVLGAGLSVVVDWFVSYWLPPHARTFAAAVAPALMVLAVVVLLTTPAGR